MPRVSLHGVPVSWSLDGPAPDPLAEVLGPFSAADPGEPGSGGVQLVLRPAPSSAALDPGAEGYLPIFFLGIIQAYREAPRRDSGPLESGGALATSAVPAPFLLWDRASRVRIPLDGSPIEAAIAPPDREITPGSAAAMLQIALALALRREGLFHLHAAALVHPSGAGVLVAGGSGAGKTTTAIALIEAGCAYLGDDSVFLRGLAGEGRDAAELLSFPRDFHVGSATLRAFPRLEALAGRRAGQPEKLAIDPRQAFPGRALRASRLPAVLLFPSIAASASTEMVVLSRADAFGQLIASSAAILLDGTPRRAENIALLRRVVEAASCFEIRLGRDVLEAPLAALSGPLERALANL